MFDLHVTRQAAHPKTQHNTADVCGHPGGLQ
jgi:hypothetical protein